jgi:hypothetical protein
MAIKSSAFTPNSLYISSAGSWQRRALYISRVFSTFGRTARHLPEFGYPGVIPQLFAKLLLVRYPTWSFECFAVLSSAIFARKRFVPMPALGRDVKSALYLAHNFFCQRLPSMPYTARYFVASIKLSSTE